jgi:cytochrome c oxidase subunit II
LRPVRSARLLRSWAFFILAGVALLVLGACAATTNQNPTGDADPPNFFPGEVVTEQGALSAGLYGLIFFIAAAVFLVVEGLLIWIAIRYRRRATDTQLPTQTHGHNGLEILWTVIPAIIVTILFVLVLGTLERVQARTGGTNTDGSPGVTVDVTGFQWQWTFEYPQFTGAQGQPLSYTGAGSEGPELVLPTNQTIHFNLTAQDVIHSFYVPQFFYKLDVVPGRINQFEVVIKQEGTFGGQCAEFCGLAHNDMYFTVRAVPRAEFDAWVAAEQEKAQATPEPAPSGAATIAVTSVGIVQGFDPQALNAPADTPLTIELTNADATAPHDFAIAGTPEGDWQGDPDAGPGGSAVYQAPPLPAGDYEFYCSIHPNMRGTLKVGD